MGFQKCRPRSQGWHMTIDARRSFPPRADDATVAARKARRIAMRRGSRCTCSVPDTRKLH
jgi:hypothetical protein